MTVNRDTYISKFLELLGLQNVITDEQRYPTIDICKYSRKEVDLILLSSEPWPFRRRDADSIRDLLGEACPKLYWIDGKACSWYGSYTLDALISAKKGPINGGLVKAI